MENHEDKGTFGAEFLQGMSPVLRGGDDPPVGWLFQDPVSGIIRPKCWYGGPMEPTPWIPPYTGG